jgi:hypothetical protein
MLIGALIPLTFGQPQLLRSEPLHEPRLPKYLEVPLACEHNTVCFIFATPKLTGGDVFSPCLLKTFELLFTLI